MSTNGESDRERDENRAAIPPEWRARQPRSVDAVVLVPAWRREWAARVLSEHCRSVHFADDLDELLSSTAEIAVLSKKLLWAAPEERWVETMRRWREEPDPLWVIVDAPDSARERYPLAGVDIAVGAEISETELSARIAALLRRARIERDRNPLTGLPGNHGLREYLCAKLVRDETITLVMADLDDFKAYNDRRGHLAGDAAIMLLADAMTEAAGAVGGVVTHLGGDDFCAIATPEAAEKLVRAVEAGYARRLPALAGGHGPGVTVVQMTVAPEELEALEQVFERLAKLRLERRRRAGRG